MRKGIVATISLSLLLGVLAFAAPKQGEWTGVVADEKCAMGKQASNTECVAKCIAGGAKAVLVTDKREVLEIKNVDAIKGHEGHTVKLAGSLDGKVLTVTSLKMIAKGTGAAAGEHKH